MENGKKQNVIIILLVFIIILLLLLIGFLFIGNNKFNDNKIDDVVDSQTSIEEDINNNEVIYSDWMQYILDSDIQSITLTRILDVNSENLNPVKVNLTNDDLKNIFVKLDVFKLEKVMITGMGNPNNQLDISYKYGDNIYKLSFFDKYIMTNSIENNEDKQLINLLNNTKYTDYSDDSGIGAIIFKFDDSYNGSFYDSYFQN